MDNHSLEHFVEAQSPIYDQVVCELKDGQKRTHWMWFIFPQIEGLGQSQMARRYAISSIAEGQAYLEHELLGTRLRECVETLLDLKDRTASQVLGQVDAIKLKSSLTLFAMASGGDEVLFDRALNRFYDGQKDSATIEILGLG